MTSVLNFAKINEISRLSHDMTILTEFSNKIIYNQQNKHKENNIISAKEFDAIIELIKNKPIPLSLCPSIQQSPFQQGEQIPEPEYGLLGAIILQSQQCGKHIGFKLRCKKNNGTICNMYVTILNIPNIKFCHIKFVKNLNPIYQIAISNYIVNLIK